MTAYFVNASSDDAEENAGVVTLTSATWQVTTNHTVGLRWTGVVPETAVNWLLRIVPDNATKNLSVDCDIYAHAHDNSPTFVAGGTDITTRTKTAAFVTWTNPALPGVVYNSAPDITAVINEVISRPGWVSGNAISIILVPRSSQVLVCTAWDATSSIIKVASLLAAPSAPPLAVLPNAPGHLGPFSAFHNQQFSWNDDGPDVPAFPFFDVHQPRPLREIRPKPGRKAETVPPQFNPPYPHSEIKQPRRPRGAHTRGSARTFVTPAQETPQPEIAARRRDLRAALRRGKARDAAPPQVNPPYPWSEIFHRPFRGVFPRKARRSEAVPPQFNPPYPFAETKQQRAPRGFLRRKSKPIEVTPAQIVNLQNDAPWSRGQQRRDVRSLRRYVKRPEVIPPQFNPPFPFSEVVQPRRAKGLWRRGFGTRTVPPQEAPLDERIQPRRTRGMPTRRAKPIETVPPQFNPPYPFAPIKQPRVPRGFLRRKSKPIEAAPPQVILIQSDVPWSRSQTRAVRGLLSRRTGHPVMFIFPGAKPVVAGTGVYLERDSIRIIPLVTNDGGATWRPRGT